jgi:Cu(I)/Ag(I) efflux system membrane fusion protein
MPQPEPRSPVWRVVRPAVAVAVARLRFVLAVGALLAVIAGWPVLRAAFDTLTTSPRAGNPVSGDTEYWCPMCPGVVSDWPAKCPVCSMALVRRQKGDMTPLPDGVVARVQLSPYRIQLAGVRTTPVEFRRLDREVVVAGLLEPSPAGSLSHTLAADVFEPDASALSVGQTGAATADLLPDDPLTARVADIAPAATPEAGRRVRVRIDGPRGGLRTGAYVAVTFRTPDAALESSRRAEAVRWGEQAAAGGIAGPDFAFPVFADAAVRHAAAANGLTLCVPEAAVIDTGRRRVVYVEAMPGVYDAVEVRLGRRCGDHYPVRGGLELGQRVVTTGAILLDAESRLNPSVAAGYFGAGSRPTTTPPPSPAAPTTSADDDATLIAKQKICPVTGEPLGSMGAPVRVNVAGKPVFVCCKGCEKPLLKNPAQHLSKLPK